MNKALTSLNTFFLILLFLSLIFSMFSIPNLNIDETQSIKVNFYELMVFDTFGNNDRRKKIIHTLKMNYLKNKSTNVISKNLYMNLLNISDIISAISLILKKNVAPNRYSITNISNIKIFDLVRIFNKQSQKKLKVK